MMTRGQPQGQISQGGVQNIGGIQVPSMPGVRTNAVPTQSLQPSANFYESVMSGGYQNSPEFQAAVIDPVMQQLAHAGLARSGAVAPGVAQATIPFAMQAAQGLSGLREQQFGEEMGLRGQTLQESLGLGQLGLGQEAQSLSAELGRGGLDLQRELGRGNLDISRQAQALSAELGRGGLALDRQLGMGGLDLQRELGRGNLDLAQQAQALSEELGRGGLSLQQRQQGETELYNMLDRLGQFGGMSRGIDQQNISGLINLGSQSVFGAGQQLSPYLNQRMMGGGGGGGIGGTLGALGGAIGGVLVPGFGAPLGAGLGGSFGSLFG